MQFQDATTAVHKDVRIRIFAAIETGNFDEARMILEEYTEVWPQQAHALRNDLIPAYGLTL